jgi:pimeloyl-ACP methyl ester carboxylesterase
MRYAEIPGVGHAPMLDEPEAKAAIFEFLKDVA